MLQFYPKRFIMCLSFTHSHSDGRKCLRGGRQELLSLSMSANPVTSSRPASPPVSESAGCQKLFVHHTEFSSACFPILVTSFQTAAL